MKNKAALTWAIYAVVLGAAGWTKVSAEGTGRMADNSQTQIHVSPGKNSNYYHVVLALRPDMFELSVPASERLPKYKQSNADEFTDEGQFEIFLRRDRFPVSAPNCRKYLILRMPATMPSSPAAPEKIAKKRELFEAIRNLKTSPSGSMDVVVELNPYVRVVRASPLALELTGCNVFFRQSKGEYIDHVGPLAR